MSLSLSTSVTFYGQFTKAQLNEFMSQIPDHAKIRVTTYAGDMREPGTTTTFTATWVSNTNEIRR